MNFNTLEELKDRVYPALSMKKEYFEKLGINITTEDIWNFFSDKWSKSDNLTLNEIVSDILKLDYKDINKR